MSISKSVRPLLERRLVRDHEDRRRGALARAEVEHARTAPRRSRSRSGPCTPRRPSTSRPSGPSAAEVVDAHRARHVRVLRGVALDLACGTRRAPRRSGRRPARRRRRARCPRLRRRADGREVVRHEQQRGAALDHVAHPVEALLLERRVTDREHLVDDEDARLEERRDREAEPHLHAARVELHLPVDRVLDLGEGDDLVELVRRPACGRGRAGCRRC